MIALAEEIVELDFFSKILDKQATDLYKESPFLPLKNLSSSSKGANLEKLVTELLLQKGYTVTSRSNKGHDRVINGKKVEIKGSLLWGTGTHFRWQQIRTGQDYDILCCVAVYPDKVELYAASKEDCKKYLEVQNEKGEWLYNQHGGKKTNSGAFWMNGFPQDFPWLKDIEDLL